MSAKILINCDIGERGPDNPLDLELLHWIDIANLACGGHAGNRESVSRFSDLAREEGITVTAHLSYPDRAGFGRRSIALTTEQLIESLQDQYRLLAGVGIVKFHGALYNDSCARTDLAQILARWLSGMRVTTVLTLPGSALAGECEALGINVLREAYAERRYQVDPATGALSLVSRARPWASIESLESAAQQARRIAVQGEVEALTGDSEGEVRLVPIPADTICIHSDSVIALPLARKLAEIVRP